MCHPLKLRAHSAVEHQMPVTVDRAPPRRHAIDQLAAIGQPQTHTVRADDLQCVTTSGHRAVRMRHVTSVKLNQPGMVDGHHCNLHATRARLSCRAPALPPDGLDELTPREHEVLRLVAVGLTNLEIAVELHVSRTQPRPTSHESSPS